MPPDRDYDGDTGHNDETLPLLAQRASPAPEPPPPPEEERQFRRNQVILLCCARLVEPIAFVSIFSFVSEMVRDVGGVPVTDVGFYSGLIESVFAVVQMCVMLFWGRLSDRVGRKPILIACTAGVAVSCVAFGFSTSIAQMIVFRCLAGIMGASLVTIRTMITENCTPETMGTAFAWFSVAGNAGIMVGPLLGGILANPVSQYGWFPRIRFLVDYPFCLPGIVTGLIGFVAVVMCALYLDETLPTTPKSDPEEPDGSGCANTNNPGGRLSVVQILKSPGVPNVLAANAFMFILSFGYMAVSPVYTYTPVEYGGFSFSPFYISLFLFANGLSQAAYALFVFPWLHRRLGTRRCVQVLSAWYPVVFLPIPLLNVLLRQGTPFAARLFWVLLCIYLMIAPGISMVFTATHILVNEVAPTPQSLGTLTGMVLSLANVFRSTAPAFFTSMYEVSIKGGVLGGHIFWGLFVVFGMGYAISARYLPQGKK